jgi:complex iron-sulfur molybdoenzyme family reductase subunit gamma
MTSDRARAAGVLLAALVLVTTAVLPTLVAGRPANQVPVKQVVDGGALSEPQSGTWDTVPTVEVPLSSAQSGLPGASNTSVSAVNVKSARTDGRLYVRLSWADSTADESIAGPRDFADAAAVQLPANTSEHPAITMGSTRSAVNVWYWHADGTVEELLAGGPGTTTLFQNGSVEATATTADGRWYVVYERPLESTAANRTNIRLERDVDVAFAVWNGSNDERSGRKAVSEWYHLALGPGPSGPPYEALLWTVAGLAIVGVATVTVTAVRRA